MHLEMRVKARTQRRAFLGMICSLAKLSANLKDLSDNSSSYGGLAQL